MARHELTLEERRRGVLKAINSKKTPKRLRKGLKKYAKKMKWMGVR